MKSKLIFILLLLAVLAACDSAPAQPPPALPTPGVSNPFGAAYPLPGTTPLPQGPPFTLQKPLTEGDKVVKGKGPASVPIRIMDVSIVATANSALELGSGAIGPNGEFAIAVDPPLEAGHSIGIQIGDLTGTAFRPENYVRSDTYRDIPLIGSVFDTAQVAPR